MVTSEHLLCFQLLARAHTDERQSGVTCPPCATVKWLNKFWLDTAVRIYLWQQHCKNGYWGIAPKDLS